MPTLPNNNRAHEVRIVHAVLRELLERIEEQMHNPEAHAPEEVNFWWGKDSVLSVLTKVTQILSKTIPLEESLAITTPDESGISEEDSAILQRYVDACMVAAQGD